LENDDKGDILTDRRAKKVKLFQALFFVVPAAENPVFLWKTGALRDN
jgi:hypothetical protein